MMHQGVIDEVGTHEELIDKKGRYYALYRQQEITNLSKRKIFISLIRDLQDKC